MLMVTWRESNVLFNVINKLKLTLRKQVKYNNLYIKSVEMASIGSQELIY